MAQLVSGYVLARPPHAATSPCGSAAHAPTTRKPHLRPPGVSDDAERELPP